jgi:hypothetical protein
MNTRILMIAAIAFALAPSLASAAPGGNGPTSTNGPNHMNGPAATGEPGADCELLVETGMGSTPGHSADAPGSAFNPDGNAGTHYAGEQPQNSRNSASVSQYDVGCLHGTRGQ